MIKRLYQFMIVSLTVFLFGCASTPKTIIKTERVFIEPPTEYRTKCDVPEPFNKNAYLSSNASDREDMFSNLVIALYKSMAQCNSKIESLDQWSVKQKEIFKKE